MHSWNIGRYLWMCHILFDETLVTFNFIVIPVKILLGPIGEMIFLYLPYFTVAPMHSSCALPGLVLEILPVFWVLGISQCTRKTPFASLRYFLMAPTICMHISLAPYCWWWLGPCGLQNDPQKRVCSVFKIDSTLGYDFTPGVFLRYALLWWKGIEPHHNKIHNIYHSLFLDITKMWIWNDTSAAFLDYKNSIEQW